MSGIRRRSIKRRRSNKNPIKLMGKGALELYNENIDNIDVEHLHTSTHPRFLGKITKREVNQAIELTHESREAQRKDNGLAEEE